MPGITLPSAKPDRLLGGRIELVIDGGSCPREPTTVIELLEEPRVLRQGCGPVDFLEP